MKCGRVSFLSRAFPDGENVQIAISSMFASLKTISKVLARIGAPHSIGGVPTAPLSNLLVP